MSVCAKLQLSSWSRRGWKVCVGWGGGGEHVATMSNSNAFAELRWVLTTTNDRQDHYSVLLSSTFLLITYEVTNITYAVTNTALMIYGTWKRRPIFLVMLASCNFIWGGAEQKKHPLRNEREGWKIIGKQERLKLTKQCILLSQGRFFTELICMPQGNHVFLVSHCPLYFKNLSWTFFSFFRFENSLSQDHKQINSTHGEKTNPKSQHSTHYSLKAISWELFCWSCLLP